MLASFTTEPSPRVTFGANRLDRLGRTSSGWRVNKRRYCWSLIPG